MWPTVCTHMALAHLIYCPSTLPDPITALEVEIFNYVKDAYTHPNAFVSWLFKNSETYLLVGLWERLIHHCDGVASCSFTSFGLSIGLWQDQACCFRIRIKLYFLCCRFSCYPKLLYCLHHCFVMLLDVFCKCYYFFLKSFICRCYRFIDLL